MREILDNVTAALETTLAHFGKDMPEADRRSRSALVEEARTTLDRPEPFALERLRNGALVIDRKPIGNGPHNIVLAKSSGPQPFVTWAEYCHPGEKPATGHGHYFNNVWDAAEDFRKR